MKTHKKRLHIHFVITEVDDSHIVQGKKEKVFSGSDSKEQAIKFVEEEINKEIKEFRN